MINLSSKEQCCGCKACGDVCPKKAISFKTDIEGFWYPEVDQNLCIDCKLCEKVCPIINIDSLKKNDLPQSECHAAIHKNIEIRFDSTSGGLFSALAEATYKAGGYVGGAIFTEDYGVKFFISNNKKDLSTLRSSKYLQSDTEGLYIAVRDLVKAGERVLVCGSPCQMAALRAFLKKDYENLIIVDFICRGTNSPKVFRKYLDYLEDRFGSKVVYYKAKNKELGWRQLTSKIRFANGQTLYDTRDINYFTVGYLNTGVYSRPSCYDCKFKDFPRISDITLADLWGAEKIVGKDLDGDMGTSLVMVNSQKGMKYFESIKASINEQIIPFKSVLAKNPALVKPLNPPLVDREQFYKDLDSSSFGAVAKKYISRPIDSPISSKRKLKNILGFVKAVIRVSGFSLSTWWKNIYYNLLCSRVHTTISLKHYVLISKHVVLELHPKSCLKVNGILKIGEKKFANSKLETRVLIEDGATWQVDDDWVLFYGSDLEIFKNALFHVEGIGGTNINSTIICGEHIHFGRGVMIGRAVTIRDNNGNHYIARRGYKNTRPVHIGQHAWLCEGCTIIAGAKIGDGAIIGAKALVASAVPAFTMVAGNPAQVVDEDVYWKY
ncbi:Coenzyme F420 hydrogenase/dehydrogenase, beta subunit C-terminal domain [Fibrobacter sp. UWB5]|uniref:Coenzyme F420 hydrogenase/dehydrogenase, beta subunit C-terminal domain n=1 Tax=Fibrobacter sp. UWB5 TaxID=1964360 RepID=UPI000B528AF4|nr:Coenzyme F420 hydrogenase/dehydrogenase, beta subunit C-terminal domain [Fibrobacter sp. UWB5]OWV14317.1 dehydrogenase [Fibrobacter sp. UWB5]